MKPGGFTSPEQSYPAQLGRASSDGSGRFRLDAPRISSSSHDEFGAVALAPGFGAGWAKLDPGDNQPTADIALRPERVIQGRLFDLQGQPVPDVKLSVTAIRRALNKGEDVASRDRFEGPAFWWAHPDDLPGWPRPVVSDADGRFTLHGVGPGLRVFVNVHDPRFSSQSIEIDTDAASAAKPLGIALQSTRTITGRVTYADTGKPVPHARVTIGGFGQLQAGVGPGPVISETDAEGRFRANAGPGDRGGVTAAPPEGQSYLGAYKRVDWPKGAIAQTVNLTLPRGTMIRGKVTEQGSGQPIAGAVVFHFARRTPDEARVAWRGSQCETSADGSFELAAPSRPGYLIVRGPTEDYVLQEIGDNQFLYGKPGGVRTCAHAFVACNPGPAGENLDVQVALRRSTAVKGRILGPDGQPVQDAWMISRVNFNPQRGVMLSWYGAAHGNARNGRFELQGLDTDTEVPVHFLDPQHKMGATVRFSGKSAAGEPITVRLGPCGTATARLVDPEGKPIGGLSRQGLISMLVTPGPMGGDKAAKEGALLAEGGLLIEIDPINYRKGPVSDSLGQVVFPALIPAQAIASSTTRRPAIRPALRSARSSPSSPARPSTWAISGSRSPPLDSACRSP